MGFIKDNLNGVNVQLLCLVDTKVEPNAYAKVNCNVDAKVC